MSDETVPVPPVLSVPAVAQVDPGPDVYDPAKPAPADWRGGVGAWQRLQREYGGRASAEQARDAALAELAVARALADAATASSARLTRDLAGSRQGVHDPDILDFAEIRHQIYTAGGGKESFEQYLSSAGREDKMLRSLLSVSPTPVQVASSVQVAPVQTAPTAPLIAGPGAQPPAAARRGPRTASELAAIRAQNGGLIPREIIAEETAHGWST